MTGTYMNNKKSLWLILGLAIAPGCAPAVSPPPQPTAGERGALTQQLSFLARQRVSGATEWVPLSPEDVLHTGDRYQIEVRTVHPAYVYVARSSGDRPMELLLPRPGASASRTAPPAPVRLPSAEDGYAFDGQVGEESIICLAADRELPEATVKQHMSSAVPAEQGNGREMPPGLTDKNRGDTMVYLGNPLAKGVLGLRFSFQRQK